MTINTAHNFCELMPSRILENRIVVYNICLSVYFTLTGADNKHDWSDENPLLCRENHSQRPQKLNV